MHAILCHKQSIALFCSLHLIKLVHDYCSCLQHAIPQWNTPALPLQVATDTRLWLMNKLIDIRGSLADLLRASVARAEQDVDVLMPGFTHLQPAMTVRWSHWLLGHAAAWQRDDMRLRDLMPRVAMLPLGSGSAFTLWPVAITDCHSIPVAATAALLFSRCLLLVPRVSDGCYSWSFGSPAHSVCESLQQQICARDLAISRP